MKNVLTPLAKSVLMPLRLMTAVSVTSPAIQKKFMDWDDYTDIEMIKCIEESVLLNEAVSTTIENEANKQKVEFIGMFVGILASVLLGNMRAGKRVLNNFEIQKYYQDEPKLNGVYPRNNLPKIKDGAYALTLNEYNSIGTH